MYFAGLDIGSQSSEAVIINAEEQIVAWALAPTGARSGQAGHHVLEQALQKAGLAASQLQSMVATGYGRISVPSGIPQLTEITCHALGAGYYFPDAGLVLDIGGQDCKAIRLDERGRPRDFLINDKCAAGTGRFLEVMAARLEVTLPQLAPLALSSGSPCSITSLCTVFAESEVVSLIARNTPAADIAAGLIQAVVSRLWSMLRSFPLDRPLIMSGGGGHNQAIVTLLRNKMSQPVLVPPEPQIIGALGAALAARRKQIQGGGIFKTS